MNTLITKYGPGPVIEESIDIARGHEECEGGCRFKVDVDGYDEHA